MLYSTALRVLESLQGGAIYPGLHRIDAMLRACGRPERRFRAVHIAGTNGKGTTAAILASVLQHAGFRTGLYTSPHIWDFNERIRVNGRPILHRDVAAFTAARYDLFQSSGATYFEAATLLAFEHFARSAVEVAVVETGLGGRWDATTMVRPDCTIVTGIGLDHVQILGRTLAGMAFEKAGIFKPGVPAVIGACPAPAADRLRAVAGDRRAPLREAAEESTVTPLCLALEGTVFSYRDPWGRLPELSLPLAGRHQLGNARTALYALRWLRACGWRVDDADLRRGLAAVRWPGRLQIAGTQPLVLADVTHNPSGARATAATLRDLLPRRPVRLVFGMLRNKDLQGVLRAFAPAAETLCAFPLPASGAVPAEEIRQAAEAAGITARAYADGPAALHAAKHRCGDRRYILITGSHLAVQNVLPKGFS